MNLFANKQVCKSVFLMVASLLYLYYIIPLFSIVFNFDLQDGSTAIV